MKFTDWLINKVGNDKLLHFTIAGLITFSITVVLTLQEDFIDYRVIFAVIISIIPTMILVLIKEFIIDGKANKKDIIASLLGSLIPTIIFSIGYLLNILSN